MMIAAVLRELMAAGLQGDALIAAIERVEMSAMSSGHPADKRVEKLRAYDRERKRKTRGNPAESSGNPADTPETPLISSSLTSLSTNEGSEESKEENKRHPKRRSSGHPLPDSWQPHEKHFAAGEALGLGRAAVDGLADEMRHWAKSNEHRPVAKKSDWDSAFYGWIKRVKPITGHRPLTPNEQQKARSDDALAKLREYNRNLADAGSPDDCWNVSENHGGRPRDVLGGADRFVEPIPARGGFGDSQSREWDRNETHVLAIARRNTG
jgi:hypothetical protein